MSRFIVLLLGIGWACATLPARAGSVVLLGDSLSAAYGIPLRESWPEALRQRLASCVPPRELINASISGETTAGGLRRYAELHAQYQPDLLLLELGANDGLRGLPLAQMESNLRAMIQTTVDAGGRVLLFEMRIPTNYGPRYTDDFRARFRSIADDYPEVTLLPFFLEAIALDPQMFLDDGIHPSVAAQPILLETVWASVQPLLSPSASEQGRGPTCTAASRDSVSLVIPTGAHHVQ